MIIDRSIVELPRVAVESLPLSFAVGCMMEWVEATLRRAVVAAIIAARYEPTEALVSALVEDIRELVVLGLSTQTTFQGCSKPMITAPDGGDLAEWLFIRIFYQQTGVDPSLFGSIIYP